MVGPIVALIVLGLVLRQPGSLGGYEGLYISTQLEGDSWNYIKLYRDGTVMAVTSSGNPKQVNTWFNKSHPAVSKGLYYVQNGTIQFSATSPAGTVDYRGKINKTHLQLHIHSRINGYENDVEYKLIESLPPTP